MNRAAQELGRLGRGKAKRLTAGERQRRADWMRRFNATRAERAAAKLGEAAEKAAPFVAGVLGGGTLAVTLAWLVRGLT